MLQLFALGLTYLPLALMTRQFSGTLLVRRPGDALLWLLEVFSFLRPRLSALPYCLFIFDAQLLISYAAAVRRPQALPLSSLALLTALLLSPVSLPLLSPFLLYLCDLLSQNYRK